MPAPDIPPAADHATSVINSIVFGAGAIIAALGGTWRFFGGRAYEKSESTKIVLDQASLADLSPVLNLLRRQTEIQERQAEIQERQAEIQERQAEALERLISQAEDMSGMMRERITQDEITRQAKEMAKGMFDEEERKRHR